MLPNGSQSYEAQSMSEILLRHTPTLYASRRLARKTFLVSLLSLVLLSVTGLSQTSNDDFGSCVALNGTSGSRSDTNTVATKEAGEPDHAGNAGGKSLWYCWTAPGSNSVTFDTLGSTFDTLLAVYVGNGFTNLSLIASNDDIVVGVNPQSSVSFTPAQGTVYHIAVDGYDGATGDVALNWQSALGPTAILADAWWTLQQDCNGDGCNAGSLTGNRARLNWSPQVTNCDGTLTVYEVVYSKPCGSNDWSAIYTNLPHPITACLSSNAQQLDIQLATGCACRDYKIELYRSGEAAPDDIRSSANDLDLSQHGEQSLAEDNCSNNRFAFCSTLSGVFGSRADNNATATKEPGEPNHAGDPGGKSLWYCWTAPGTNAITFDTIGSSFDTLLAVYSGDSLTNLSLIASDDDIVPDINIQSTVTFTPTSGTTYHIAVDGFGGAAGSILLNWRSVTPGPTAVLADAWWTYQQDCNGDGCKAGTLPDNRARLNWSPDVFNCNGTLTVFEIVYASPCGSNAWTAIYTNDAHAITGCRSTGEQFVDVQMGTNCQCRDYQIEVYRAGQTVPDDVRSSANDPDLAQHREQPLSEDFCLSDFFATCVSLNGAYGSEADDNSFATKEPGEPDHAGDAGGKSLWYCWTALTNTPMTLDTIGSGFDTLLAVYTGDSVSNLSLVVSNNDIAGSSNRQSRVTFVTTPGTTYHIAVDGFGGASGLLVLNWNQLGSALPDLIIWGPAASPTVIVRSFTTNDCEVVEGCETAGEHVLLSFTTETRNIGTGDLVMGNPATNSLFRWASCHQHYHFEQFAEYNLLDTNGNVVATGHKVGFCLEDVHTWSPTANPQIKYDCNFQGIQSGWADLYTAGLPCQYIDITSVPPGNYLLQMTVNPDNLLPESNTANNMTMVPVTVGSAGCISPPPNDEFANAIVVTNTPFSFSEVNACGSKQEGEPNHAGDSGGNSVWFSWTPTSNHTAVITTKRSDFDTLLAVYTGNSVSALTLAAENDDIIQAVLDQSSVTFAATAGTTYHIVVDGWQGAVGTVVLNINPPGNDDFASGYQLVGTSGTTNGYTIGASKEPGEPAHAGDVGGRSVWYNWTAPATGPVDFNTAGSTFDTTLGIYTGNALTALTAIAHNNNDVGALLSSRVDFPAVGGTTYRIAIDGFGADSGNLTLSWDMESQLGIAAPGLDGNVRITFTGVNGQKYALLVSSNLDTWFTQAIRTMSGNSEEYTEPVGLGARFYKTVLVP
jgi:hypothetical protein